MNTTGIRQLDELINPAKREWVLEVYGDQDPVLRVLHYTMAYRSRSERVYLLFNMEFGGLDTLYLVRLCRLLDCRLENIVVSRAFRLSDTVEALESLTSISNSLVLVLYPYSYVSRDPLRYSEATWITGLISRIAHRNQVLLFNTTTRFGAKSPEGGSFHHHAVKVIIKLSRKRRLVTAELVKHPVKQWGFKTIPYTILEHPAKCGVGRTILDWVMVENGFIDHGGEALNKLPRSRGAFSGVKTLS